MAASNVLETFYILFDTNADKTRGGLNQVEQDANKAQGALNDADTAGVLLGDHLVESFKNLATAALAFFSIDAIHELLDKTSELNAQLFVTSERLGVSVEDLDAWQRATVRAGGSADGFTQTLDFLNKGLAGLNTPGGVSRLKPFLEELKINPKTIHTSLQLLQVLSDKSKELGAQQFAGIAERFGIDPGTQLLLANGRRALDDQIAREKELGGVTREQAEAAHKYQQAVEDLKNQLYDFGTSIVGFAYPALEKLLAILGKGVEFLSAHKQFVLDFFIAVAGVITAIYLPAITEAATATIATVGPWLLVAAVVAAAGAAIALLVDDVQNFLDGNQSVIGTISQTWPVVGEVVRATVADMGAAIKWFFDLLSGLIDFGVAAWDFLVASITTGLNLFSQKFPAIAGVIKLAAEGIILALRGVVDIIETIVGLIGKLPSFLHFEAKGLEAASKQVAAANPGAVQLAGPSLLDFTKTAFSASGFAPAPLKLLQSYDVQHGVQKAQESLHTVNASPLTALAATPAAPRPAPDVKVQIDNINITTPSTDPVEHGKIVADHIENQVRQTIAHYDDGVQS